MTEGHKKWLRFRFQTVQMRASRSARHAAHRGKRDFRTPVRPRGHRLRRRWMRKDERQTTCFVSFEMQRVRSNGVYVSLRIPARLSSHARLGRVTGFGECAMDVSASAAPAPWS